MNNKVIIYMSDGQSVELSAEQDAMLRAMYKKEIAALYGLPASVMCRKLKKAGLAHDRGYLSKEQVLLVFMKLGWPPIRVI